MPPPVDFRERSASRSPSSFTIALDNGQATTPLRFDEEDKLEGAILSIVGTCEPRGDGRLSRICPLRHGRFKGYYSERIAGAEGIGKGMQANGPLPGDENGNSLDIYSRYETWIFNTSFQQRPYNVRPDSAITRNVLTWNTGIASTTVNVETNEWSRWTDWDVIDDDTWLEADQGCMTVVASDAAIVPTSGIHGQAFVGKPRLFIKQSKLICIWFNVPFYYITHTNSWIRRCKDTINQFLFLGYDAGTLLFRGGTVLRKWTPFDAGEEPPGSPYVGGLRKNCDVRLEWHLRDTITVTGPTDDAYRLFTSPFNAAPNFLTGGWISHAMVDPSDPNNKAKWYPTYDSMPHSLIFTDPAI